MANDVANDIKQGFNALGGAVKEAGKKRVMELVQKQGYVAYKNPLAAEQFKNDPNYKNWKCQIIEGEYRFFPPVNDVEEKKDKDILSEYKRIQKNTNVNIYFLVKVEGKMCSFSLVSEDKRTGERKEELTGQCAFDGKFLLETLPSIYYYTSYGMPVDRHVRQGDTYSNVNYMSYDGTRVILIGNLSDQQLTIIDEMTEYVDNKLGFNVKGHSK